MRLSVRPRTDGRLRRTNKPVLS